MSCQQPSIKIIKVEEHVIALVEGTVYYNMPANFMYPMEAFGEVDENSTEDNPIPINNDEAEESIFFHSWNVAQVPSSNDGNYVSVIYVAKPVSVTVEQAEDGISVLDLPDVLVDCLLSYIGYRAHVGVKSDANSENNAPQIDYSPHGT